MPAPGQVKSDRYLRILAHRLCPVCGHDLTPGPRGAAARNFYCTNRTDCRLGFNLTFVAVRPDGRSELAFAERIGEVDDERFAMYAKAV